MKKLFIAVTALCVAAVSVYAEETLGDRVGSLQTQIDDIMAKAGIQFSGEFRSQLLHSALSEPDDESVVDPAAKRSESVMFTSVDFDITARPNSALTARAMFRLHQDWRNFFSDVQNPITTRWLSIDGSMLDGFLRYNFGDYSKKISPLTLWSPDLELPFEPEIFAQGRRLAMSEVFLGDNNRQLQGGNIEFKAGFEMPHELQIGVFGARLAIRGTTESGVTPPGTGTSNAANGIYVDAPWDKYLLGANLETQIFDGLSLGVTYMHIYDALTSFDAIPGFTGDLETASKVGFLGRGHTAANPAVSAQSTGLIAGRLNFDTRAVGMDDPIRVGLDAEFAMSMDKIYYALDTAGVRTPITFSGTGRFSTQIAGAADTMINGMAINAGLNVRFSLSEEDAVTLRATYIMNDLEFRNDAAQSPSFIPFPIMNNENISTVNPFDAMYRSVFKYAPSQFFGGARPYMKNSYGNAILPRHIAAQQNQLPFQAALPGGLATADRVGPVISLDGSALEGGVKFGVRAAALTGMEDENFAFNIPGDGGFEEDINVNEDVENVFLEVIVGASFDIAKFAPAVGPSLEIGGSFGMYNQSFADMSGTDRIFSFDNENTLIGVGLNYQFHQRFGLLAGFQTLTVKSTGEFLNGRPLGENDERTVETETTFDNLSFGFNYRVADGGNITLKLTRVSAQFNEEDTYDDEGNRTGSFRPSYSAWQPEVFLTVRF